MALRDYIVHEVGDQLDRKLTYPASGGKVGDPCLVGDRPGILYTDQDENGMATVKFCGSHRFRVHGVASGGGAAVAVNDAIFYDPSPGAGNANLNKDATNGIRFGTAAEAVASGAQTVIVVDLHG